MPIFWVEQTQGPLVEQVSTIHRLYKSKHIGRKLAFIKLCEIHQEAHDRHPFAKRDGTTLSFGEQYDVYAHRGHDHVDYFIFEMLPRMITRVFSGSGDECDLEANYLNRLHSAHVYKVRYEY